MQYIGSMKHCSQHALSVYFPLWSQKVTADTKFSTLFAHHFVMSKHVGSPSKHHMHPSILQLISWIMLQGGVWTYIVYTSL